MLENANIDQETAVQLTQIETARPAVVLVAQEKRYIPKLPNLHPEKCLCTFLTRFSDNLKAAQITEIQWWLDYGTFSQVRCSKLFRTCLKMIRYPLLLSEKNC